MRVAVSGTHRVGKSQLIAALAEAGVADVIDEPYRVLEDEGYEFSDPPTFEDFEAQLRRSIELVQAGGTLFDRCPLDFVAYLRALDEDYDLEPWLDELRTAMDALDHVVVIRIESPDRIAVAAHEDRRLRADVDAWIERVIVDDMLGLDANVVEVSGDLEARVRQVRRAIPTLIR